MSPDRDPDQPTFRDLFDIQARTQERLDKNTERLSRMEKGLALLTLVVLAPKVGAPDPAQLIGTVFQHFA